MSPTFTDATSFANLNHALKTGSAYGVPYPFTDTTLFHSYANFGGNGVLLALVIAIALTTKTADHKYKSVTKWSLFPTLFNNHYPLMLGLPILFNNQNNGEVKNEISFTYRTIKYGRTWIFE